jgi:hypothetical protein
MERLSKSAVRASSAVCARRRSFRFDAMVAIKLVSGRDDFAFVFAEILHGVRAAE